MIITLLQVYLIVLCLMTLTLFQGHRCVRNINCKLHVLDSCLCLLNVWLVHTLKRLCTIWVVWLWWQLTSFPSFKCLGLLKTSKKKNDCCCGWHNRKELETVLTNSRLMICLFFVVKLVFWAESTTKDYIKAKNNVQSVSYLLCTQVIKPQIIHKSQKQSWHNLHKIKHTQTSNTKFSKN